MNTNQLIVWPDTTTTDRTHIELIGGKDCTIASEQFLIIEDESFRYFCKIDERPVNISPTLGRDDPATYSALTKKLFGDLKNVGIEQHNLLHYRAHLLARQHVQSGEISEPLTAPKLATLVRLATEQETILFLGLPSMEDLQRIGCIFQTTIPLCISVEVLRHHILMAGATGQGKTTAISNIIAAAYAQDATVFVFDFKPDYQRMEEAVIDGEVPRIRRKDISYYNLNERQGYRKDTQQINVCFSDIAPEMYIGKASGSDIQYDVWMHMLLRFSEQMFDSGRASWTLEEFYSTVPRTKNDRERLAGYYPTGDVPHESTLAAHYRLKRAKPAWVDVVTPSHGMLASTTRSLSFFETAQFLQPKHVHVIQVNPSADKDYGLFLSTVMRHILEQKEKRGLTHPVVVVMDEAEDVFAGTEFAKRCTATIAGVLRKGRSQNIASVISVQSAANIPGDIAQNLNSIIAFRHNSDEAAGHIKKQLGKDAVNLQMLERGNAIIQLFGAKTAVRAQLDREAFRLVKSYG